MDFAKRKKHHDTKAFLLVEKAFSYHGYSLYPYGAEQVPDLQKALRRFSDPLSKMLRYRPDFVSVHPEKGPLLLEIKSEHKNSPNFAVEYDAWEAAEIWNRHSQKVLYVFVDLTDEKLYACWPETLTPRKVFVPRQEDIERLSAKGLNVRPIKIAGGSGTAFFLVQKNSLKFLEEIIDEVSCSFIQIKCLNFYFLLKTKLTRR